MTSSLKILLPLLFCYSLANSQSFDLKINIVGEIPGEIAEEVKTHEIKNTDSLGIIQNAREVQQLLFSNSYLLSEARIIWIADTSALLQVQTGFPVKWSSLNIGYPDSFAISIPQGLAVVPQHLNPGSLSAYIETYLTFLENNGYPFAQIGFESYQLWKDSVSGNLWIQPGPYTTFDSVVVKGFDDFSMNVLRYDLRFNPRMPYSELYLNELQKYMDRIEYLTFSRAPAVAFSEGRTVLYLYIEEVKSNQIDGVVGLNTTEEGEVVFTGDFNLRLLNIFHRGEEMRLRWQRPDESVSTLMLGLTWPYIFNSPFWLGGELEIFRQDSSFVNTNAGGQLKYLIESGSFISAGIDYRSSSVLLEQESITTNFGSFKTINYKLGFERRGTNRVVVPTRGNEFLAYVYSGTRSTEDGSLQQYGWNIYDAQYLPFFNSHVLKLAIKAESLIGDDLLENELFRIGGLRSLRGFNEQSIFTSAYAIGTVEYRYMMGQFDYLTAFADMAYTEKKGADNIAYNNFLGIGAGLNFRTGGGIFSLFYAVGKANNNRFDLRTSKVHFGYINRF